MRRWCWLLIVLPSLTFAQTPRALFDEATALYAKGEFARAAEKFEASFALRPVPVTKFNTARAWEQAGETLKAIAAWQTWLEMSPQAAERPEAQASLSKLGEKLAKLGVQAVTVTALPLNARVSIDGVPRGLAPVTVELTPTRHFLRVELEGREPQERTVEVGLAAPQVERFELAAAGQSPIAVAKPELGPAPLPRPEIPRPTDPAFALSLSDDAVHVHIEADNREARLFRLNGNPNGECRMPCDVPIARSTDVFMIGGPGITTSRTFVLADHREHGRVDLKVKTGSAGAMFGGGVLLITLAIASLSVAFAFGISPGSRDNTLPVGLGLGLGLSSGLAGALVMALNGTTVKFNEN